MEEQNLLELQYDRMVSELENLEPGSEEFNKTLQQLGQIVKLMKEIEPESTIDKIMGNAVLVNLIGTWGLGFLLMNHERAHVITSRVGSWLRTRF